MADSPDIATKRQETIIRDAIAYRLTQVHTCIPAKVVSYDAATQLAECLPIVKNRVPLSDGSFFEEDYPPVPDVPVAWPRGGSSFLHLPLAPGDLVTLVISEQSYDQARTVGDVASPLTSRRHDLSDAIALPNSISAAALPVNGTDIRLGNANGSVHIKPDGTLVLGADAASLLLKNAAIAQAVQAKLDVLMGLLTGWVPVPNDGGAALKAAAIAAILPAAPTGPSWLASLSAPKVLLDG